VRVCHLACKHTTRDAITHAFPFSSLPLKKDLLTEEYEYDFDSAAAKKRFSTAIGMLVENGHIHPIVAHPHTYRLYAKALKRLQRDVPSKVDKDGEFSATKMKAKKVAKKLSKKKGKKGSKGSKGKKSTKASEAWMDEAAQAFVDTLPEGKKGKKSVA
jgi:hypothetical protein